MVPIIKCSAKQTGVTTVQEYVILFFINILALAYLTLDGFLLSFSICVMWFDLDLLSVRKHCSIGITSGTQRTLEIGFQFLKLCYQVNIGIHSICTLGIFITFSSDRFTLFLKIFDHVFKGVAGELILGLLLGNIQGNQFLWKCWQ